VLTDISSSDARRLAKELSFLADETDDHQMAEHIYLIQDGTKLTIEIFPEIGGKNGRND